MDSAVMSETLDGRNPFDELTMVDEHPLPTQGEDHRPPAHV
jgi:hypothetical protein